MQTVIVLDFATKERTIKMADQLDGTLGSFAFSFRSQFWQINAACAFWSTHQQ